jgi:hypothetical protein
VEVRQDNSVTQYFYSGDTTKQTNDTLELGPPLQGQTNGDNRLDYVDGLGWLRGVTENVLSWMGGSYGQSPRRAVLSLTTHSNAW